MDDEISIPSQSDMDMRINNILNDDSSTSSSDEDTSELLKELRNDFMADEETGPPLREDLADLFKGMKEKPLSKEKILEKSKKHPQPSNCKLFAQQVNPEIWNNALTASERSLDLKLQKVQKLITKAISANLKATNDLLDIKGKKGNKKELLKQAATNATDAVALLTTANDCTATLRRDLMVKSLEYEQRGLGKDVPIDNNMLFGDDLNKRLTEIAGVNKLKIKRKSFKNNSKNYYRSQKSPRDQRYSGYKNKQWYKNQTYQTQKKQPQKKNRN